MNVKKGQTETTFCCNFRGKTQWRGIEALSWYTIAWIQNWLLAGQEHIFIQSSVHVP